MALSYEELRKCWVKGFRNGNVRKLSRLQRALYRACLAYARKVGRIVNEFLVGRPVYEELAEQFGGFKEIDLSTEEAENSLPTSP